MREDAEQSRLAQENPTEASGLSGERAAPSIDLNFEAPVSASAPEFTGAHLTAAQYQAELPRPSPLSAEQFMPVLAPAQLAEYLGELHSEVRLVSDEAERSALLGRARVLELGVSQYAVNYDVTRMALTRTLAETGVGVRQSWARQEQHLQFMNESSSSAERAYLQATQALEAARTQRFDALLALGVRGDTQGADDLYTQAALASLAAEGRPYRPEGHKSFSARVFGAFAVFSKFFVGLLSGVSINLLFNPDSRLYLTIIALSAGVMLSVLLLWLVEELSYRARLAARRRSAASAIVALSLVALMYLGVEGYLNWDGILRVTQQLAADAAQSGTLQDLSAPGADPTLPPQHWSLLSFTLALVSMAVGAAVVQGAQRAGAQLERERLEQRVAQLKQSGQLLPAARAADLPDLLEEARSRITPPRDISSPRHAKLNEKVLTWWEQERDTQVSELSSAIVSEARELQSRLETLAADIQQARFPQAGSKWPRRKWAGLF